MDTTRHAHDPLDRDRYIDERDPYAHPTTHPSKYDAGMKRARSPSSPYGRYNNGGPYDDDPYNGAGAGGWDAKRARSRDELEHGWGSEYPPAASGLDAGGGGYSPARGRRAWHDLDPEEKEHEWQRYEREREYDRYYADANRGLDDAGYRAGPAPRLGYDRPAHLARHEDGGAPPPSYAFGGGRVDHYTAGTGENFSGASSRANGPHTRVLDPMDSPTILSFKRYTQLLRELGGEMAAVASGADATQTLYDKYQDYRNAFKHRAMKQHWRAYKDERWFVEKYSLDADAVQARRDRRRLGRQGRKAAWLNELQSGDLDKVCSDAVEEQVGSSALTIKTRVGERETLEDADTFNVPSEPNQLLIRYVPPDVSRAALDDALREETGFRYLALGEPHPLKRYGRVGCVVFDDSVADDLEQTAARLSQKTIEGQKFTFERTTRPAQAKLRVAPEYASTLSRMQHDLRQARRLVQMLEREDVDVLWKDEEVDDVLKVNFSHEIEQRACDIVLATRSDDTTEADSLRAWLTNTLNDGQGAGKDAAVEDAAEESDGTIVSSAHKRELIRLMLDLHIDLLRQVYICDYYTSTMSDFPEELLRRAPKSLRRVNSAARTAKESALAEKDKLWASNVDLKHELLMRPDDNAIGALGGTDLQAMMLELAAPYSREDEAEKHRCIVKVNEEECGKPFKAQIFVQKHVLNKHRDWFHTLMAEKIADAKYFNNYVRDPQRCMPPLNQPDRNGKDGALTLAGPNNGSGHHHSANVAPRIAGGYDYSGGGLNGGVAASSSGYYGPGNLVRLGGTAPAWPSGRRASDLRERMDDGGGSNIIRLGTTTGAIPYRRSAPGMVDSLDAVDPLLSTPKGLDPRARMAPPKSYQDLDAGVPSGGAELDLEY